MNHVAGHFCTFLFRKYVRNLEGMTFLLGGHTLLRGDL